MATRARPMAIAVAIQTARRALRSRFASNPALWMTIRYCPMMMVASRNCAENGGSHTPGSLRALRCGDGRKAVEQRARFALRGTWADGRQSNNWLASRFGARGYGGGRKAVEHWARFALRCARDGRRQLINGPRFKRRFATRRAFGRVGMEDGHAVTSRAKMVAMPTSQSVTGFPGTPASAAVVLLLLEEVLLDGAHVLDSACVGSVPESMATAPTARSDCVSICNAPVRNPRAACSVVRNDNLFRFASPAF
jgi:hypothetical protein